MNNKPVAWMDYLEHSDVYDLNVSGRGVPLYTHPVKELTDENCVIPIWLAKNFLESTDVPRFKRILEEAILRKAQEKCNGFCGEYECKENQAVCKRKAQEK